MGARRPAPLAPAPGSQRSAASCDQPRASRRTAPQASTPPPRHARQATTPPPARRPPVAGEAADPAARAEQPHPARRPQPAASAKPRSATVDHSRPQSPRHRYRRKPMSLTNQRYHTRVPVVSAKQLGPCAGRPDQERRVIGRSHPPCGSGRCLRRDRAPATASRFKVAALPSPCPTGCGSARPSRGRYPALVNHPDPLRRRNRKCRDSPAQDD